MSEIWKDVVGYEGRYEISNTGFVRSVWMKTRPAKPLGTQISKLGYVCVTLCKNAIAKKSLVHRLVATAFCPGHSDVNRQVNHKNGIKADNSSENLEWCTPKENIRHALRAGLLSCAKLKSSDISIIRKMADDKVRQKDIAAKFAVNRTTIRLIVMRKIWTHIE